MRKLSNNEDDDRGAVVITVLMNIVKTRVMITVMIGWDSSRTI